MKFQAIAMERGPCFGTCPVYRVTIWGNGSVEWVGNKHVKEEGWRTWSIPQEKIDALEKAIRKARFSDLNDNYTSFDITCNPSAITTVKFEDGTVKK